MMDAKETIGIAIPTYIRHLPYLNELLESIEGSTLLPARVVVSISSTPDYENDRIWSFPIRYISTHEYRSPAANRNVAKAALDTDIVSFIDGDDVMHSRRLEYVAAAFDADPAARAVLHNYVRRDFFDTADRVVWNRDYERRMELVPRRLQHVGTFDNYNWAGAEIHPYKTNGDIMYSQPSIRADIAKRYNYDESPAAVYQEDTKFIRILVWDGHKCVYMNNTLSLYRPSVRVNA